jgi:hypothetical protein
VVWKVCKIFRRHIGKRSIIRKKSVVQCKNLDVTLYSGQKS